jgi:hypothetical protein
MGVKNMLEHPEIGWIERTGYPSWMQEYDEFEEDSDRAYEEARDRVFDRYGEI